MCGGERGVLFPGDLEPGGPASHVDECQRLPAAGSSSLCLSRVTLEAAGSALPSLRIPAGMTRGPGRPRLRGEACGSGRPQGGLSPLRPHAGRCPRRCPHTHTCAPASRTPAARLCSTLALFLRGAGWAGLRGAGLGWRCSRTCPRGAAWRPNGSSLYARLLRPRGWGRGGAG